MTSGSLIGPAPGTGQGAGLGAGQPANLGDILERVLDKGLVIAGDIRVNLLDIELLTIKLRLVIASLDTARQVGIDWWQSDPWLNAGAASGDGRRSRRELADLEQENRRLADRVRELEAGGNAAAAAERGVRSRD
jgi:hypothetical protein